MGWYNGGVYEGLTLDQLRYVLAEFCTAINERQAALSSYEWKWVYPGLARPVWSDFTGLTVGKKPVLIGLEYVYHGLETTIKEIQNAITYGWTAAIPHPSNPGSSGVYPLVFNGSVPPTGSPFGDGTLVRIGWTDEEGNHLEPATLFANAGYGDGWLNPQPLHTNWRVYDQIRRMLEQLVYLQSGFQVRHPVNLTPYAQNKVREDSGTNAETAWDNAVVATPYPNTNLNDSALGFGDGPMVSRRMTAGTSSRNVVINEEVSFKIRVAPLPGAFHIGHLAFAEAAGYPRSPYTWYDFSEADAFDVTDQDADTWPCTISGEGYTIITKDKDETWWNDVAGSWKTLTFSQALPANSPFSAMANYGGFGNPIPFSSRFLALINDPYSGTGTSYFHTLGLGKYVRQLQVGSDLSYG